MTDALDTKIHSFLVELVDAAPAPPDFETIETTYAEVPTPERARRRSGLLVGGIACTVALAIGIAIIAIDTRGSRPSTPGAEVPTNPTTEAPPLTRADCIVHSTGVTGCPATPAQAAPLLGVTPSSPTAIPEGWSLFSEDLRIYEEMSDPALNGIAYFELWVPDGQSGIADDSGSYIQLRQRPQLPNETEVFCDPNAQRRTLVNGSLVCMSSNATVSDPLPDSGSFSANWTHNGIWFVLEGHNITRAQFEETLGTIG